MLYALTTIKLIDYLALAVIGNDNTDYDTLYQTFLEERLGRYGY